MNPSELLRQIESDSARRYGVNPKKQVYVVLGTSDWLQLVEAIKPEHSIFVQGLMEGRDFLRLNHFIVIPSMDFVDGFYLTTDYDVGTIMRTRATCTLPKSDATLDRCGSLGAGAQKGGGSDIAFSRLRLG